MSHHSSSVNGEGTSHKDPLSRILDELSSLKLWKEKLERKEKGKERVEINQDEREQIREEERRKIMKEMKRKKHVSKPQFTASLLKSATKFRVFMLGLKKPKPNDKDSNNGSDSAIPEAHKDKKHFTVKFKVEEVPIVSLFSSKANKNHL